MPVLSLPGLTLNYLHLPAATTDESPGTPVVLVHGLGANAAFWYPALAPAFTVLGPVVVPDLRGHGASGMPPGGYGVDIMAADLRALLDHLAVERAYLVGHSFGGAVAVGLALAAPERVAGLVLADVRLHAAQPRLRLRDWQPGPRWREALAEAGISLDEDHPEGGLLLLRELARLVVEDPDQARTLQRLFLGGGGGFGGRRGARRWLKLLETTTALTDLTTPPSWNRRDLRALTMPLLALVGERGTAHPTARVLADTCPQATVKTVAGAGHFFPLSRRRAFLRVTLRFLSRIGSQPLPSPDQVRGQLSQANATAQR